MAGINSDFDRNDGQNGHFYLALLCSNFGNCSWKWYNYMGIAIDIYT